MERKILIMGLPGAGKTTLARVLAPRLGAVHFDADQVRANINKDLGFTVGDRIEQARRMGWLCDRVVEAGGFAIADFVCPTAETRDAFGPAFTVWVDRIAEGRFEDTNRLFEPPEEPAIRVTAEGAPEYWAEQVAQTLVPTFDYKKPTALFVGRYQPFHDGHRNLILEGLRRVGQVCVAVRDTAGTGEKDPFAFEYVKARIEGALKEHAGRFVVVPLPNVTAIFYGRDVGYQVERIDLDEALAEISATEIRGRMGL
ncbi:MAG TPA: adenylyl-sulfate kinase [Allosphingosinicella sp.]|nr:adenylyl-sulfate kinase [Allosphingosinicella sp.]